MFMHRQAARPPIALEHNGLALEAVGDSPGQAHASGHFVNEDRHVHLRPERHTLMVAIALFTAKVT
jgi:hypothetical protein